jgi:tripartite-type tricarboxylate transporter receptor subunit TctC
MNVAEGVNEARQGVLRPLAQMGTARWAPLGDVPTLKELGFDVVEGSMRGMAAPAGLPPEILARLSLAVRRTVDDPEFKASAEQQNLPLRFLGPADYLAELRGLQQNYQSLWDRHPWRE